jgi:hypothetical protein
MHRFWVPWAISLFAAGCSSATLRPPEGVQKAQLLAVEGYSSGVKAFREKAFKIGSYTVANIERDWDQGRSTRAAGGSFGKDTKKKAYSFVLKAQARELRAECAEESEARGISGITPSRVSLRCVCREGEAPHTELALNNGRGTVRLPGDLRYDLSELHESEKGRRSSAALGYGMSGPHGSAAVDVTGNGRAWLPRDLAEDEALGLACSFASLLLYRPTR